MTKRKTGRQMCEAIARYWKEESGKIISPSDIWNYSPTGELFMVFSWYVEAKCWMAEKMELRGWKVVVTKPDADKINFGDINVIDPISGDEMDPFDAETAQNERDSVNASTVA